MSGAPSAPAGSAHAVLPLRAIDRVALARLIARYRLDLTLVVGGEAIPGSYWGDSEAGLRAGRLYVRPDTPVHSILHEAGHYICMSPERRSGLDTDAGGDDLEEEAVCYLQVLLAGQLAGVGRERLLADMDAWGYSFRLGSARQWFERDAAAARDWLERYGIIDATGRPTGELRSS
ncbi:MAG TPA: hypothetical protein VEU54_09900 [Steroidobacteraceae bacterium]|nr:hypothetical protein [Steroidobacteraceae bacterium]